MLEGLLAAGTFILDAPGEVALCHCSLLSTLPRLKAWPGIAVYSRARLGT